MSVKFEKMSPTVHVAFVSCARTDSRGRRFTSKEAVRAIKERDGWRIDKASAVAGAWMPWEPIDRKAYRSSSSAKTAIRKYATRCKRRG